MGGPVEPDEVLAMVEIPQDLEMKFKAIEVKKGLHVGDVSVITSIANTAFKLTGAKPVLKVFWGYAAWGHTQLLAELARRSWGLVLSDSYRDDVGWDEVVDAVLIAKESEYSRSTM